MPTAEPRLTWIQTAPGDMYAAECGRYTFEISKTADAG